MQINFKPYEKYIKSVKIDDREQDRVDYAKNIYSPINPIVCHLDVADYIFESIDGREVAFEYKTGSDFLTSVQSGHLHNQVWDLMTNFDHRFVIVQSPDLRKDLDNLYFSTGIDMSFAQVNGEIADDNRIATVVMLQTQFQAFDYMFRQSGKIFRNNQYKWTFGKKTPNSALNYLSAMKGLDKFADRICEQLKLRTLDDLLNLTKEDLMSVKGVGKLKAETILRNLGVAKDGQKKN